MAQLNAFFDRLASRPLSANAVALWCALMHVANRAGWPQELSVAERTLTGLLSMSHMTFSRARAELARAGLLQHIPQPGRRAPLYVLTPLVDNPGKKAVLRLVKT